MPHSKRRVKKKRSTSSKKRKIALRGSLRRYQIASKSIRKLAKSKGYYVTKIVNGRRRLMSTAELKSMLSRKSR
jgi:hypothetical protein